MITEDQRARVQALISRCCSIVATADDVVDVPFPKARQKRAGVKMKRQRFDVGGWRDVKVEPDE